MQPTMKLNDIFWTFQGEGKYTGRRALFIRLPYCNYSCPWCDTEYNSINYKIDAWTLSEFADTEASNFCVITGGEPTINKDFDYLIDSLHKIGFEIAIETNGSGEIEEETFKKINLVTVSPKYYVSNGLERFYINSSTLDQAIAEPEKFEFKYVVDDNFDTLKKNSNFINLSKNDFNVKLSPEYNKIDENMAKIEEFIKVNPQVRYSLQTHKWVGLK